MEHWDRFFEQQPVPGGRLGNLIRRGETSIPWPADFLTETREVRDEVLYRVKYRGYLQRESKQVEKLKDIENVRLPEDLDYLALPGLRRESALKLKQSRPYSLGQASRISGVNPADIAVLMVHVAAHRRPRGE